jgi:hypothetical protein
MACRSSVVFVAWRRELVGLSARSSPMPCKSQRIDKPVHGVVRLPIDVESTA